MVEKDLFKSLDAVFKFQKRRRKAARFAAVMSNESNVEMKNHVFQKSVQSKFN